MRFLFYTSLIIMASCAANKPEENSEKAQRQIVSECIQEKIEKFKAEPVQNPPISVTQYSYEGKLVYLISAPCCDQYSTLYNEKCEVICHPSGGITGRGDGKIPDFFEKATNEKVIWQDTREK